MASGGREPAHHDPRGRLEAAPRGSSAAGQAGTTRSGLLRQKIASPPTSFFCDPLSVPLVLRMPPNAAEAPPGRNSGNDAFRVTVPSMGADSAISFLPHGGVGRPSSGVCEALSLLKGGIWVWQSRGRNSYLFVYHPLVGCVRCKRGVKSLESYAASCGTSSTTSTAASCAASFTCPSFTCHLRASVVGGTRVLGVGSKGALAADRTSLGVGLSSGSPRAAAHLFAPSCHGEDDDNFSALHECADGLLHEVLRL